MAVPDAPQSLIGAFEKCPSILTMSVHRGGLGRLRVVEPPRVSSSEDSLFAATYVNAYTPNGAVIASKFGDKERDRQAERVLAEAFPGRAVRMLSAPNIARGGGGIRCLVQPVPAAG